ncbi:MAG: DUF1848 domain-containing protein [Calditrichaeota bacterium]|nr:MAG: DUF1848 domain-containing protein [Calditrichota bacterium]
MLHKNANIISASRRTDIPAFYARWFINRIRDGFVLVSNPFNAKQVYRVSLRPEDVVAIVFWTRNPRPLLPYLPELQQRGFRFYFQWSLNNYPTALEARGPSLKRTLETFHQVAERLSPGHIQWRYDPIILSNQTPFDWHIENFSLLASQLQHATRRCYFSFVDFYKKTQKNLLRLQPEIWVDNPPIPLQKQLIQELQKIAAMYHIQMFACCEDHLLDIPGIQKAHCVDIDLIYALYPEVAGAVKIKSTRPQCGCFASKDIGAYDSCLFRCAYCYANANFEARSLPRYARHLPDKPMLIP